MYLVCLILVSKPCFTFKLTIDTFDLKPAVDPLIKVINQSHDQENGGAYLHS